MGFSRKTPPIQKALCFLSVSTHVRPAGDEKVIQLIAVPLKNVSETASIPLKNVPEAVIIPLKNVPEIAIIPLKKVFPILY